MAPSQEKYPISLHIFAAPPPLLSNTSLQAIKFNISGAFSLIYSITVSVTSLCSPVSVTGHPHESEICYWLAQATYIFNHSKHLHSNFLAENHFFPHINKETCCGVVTTIALSIPVAWRNWTIEMCSSEVPGGESATRKSSSPPSTHPSGIHSFGGLSLWQLHQDCGA